MKLRSFRNLAEITLEPILDDSKPHDNHAFTVTNAGINIFGDGIAWFTIRVSHTKGKGKIK